jgi:hypothetical protein
MTATCLLVSSSSRFPIAVVSSMIDPFIFSSSVVFFFKWARSHLFASGLSDSTRFVSRVWIAARCRVTGADHRSICRSRNHAALAGLRGLDMGQV